MSSKQTIGTIRWDLAEDGVVTLTMDDPAFSANTMNEAYIRSMAEVVERLAGSEGLRGVIVTSGKRTFFAGADLDDLISAGPDDAGQILATVTEVTRQLRRLETLGVPVVAAINGSALGGGLEIALACHHRVVLDDPRVKLGFPEVTLGLMPGAGGVVRTVRLLGLATALTELLLRGQQISARRAVELGLVHEVASDKDELLAAAHAFIEANSRASQPYDERGYRVPGGIPSSPALAAILPSFPANLVKQLKGAHLPAPHHILCAAVESLQVDVGTALTVEARYFVDLLRGQISHNMIQAFWFDLNRVNGGASRPGGVPEHRAHRVAVLGAGMMGAGIAYVCAKAGLDVMLKDVSLEAAERGKAYSAKVLGKLTARGRVSETESTQLLARITPTATAADLAGCDLVVEAVYEDQALKRAVFAEIDDVVAADALLASNTSTLPISSLAEGVDRPTDFVGMHFFSPADRMPLVELIVGARTSPQALAKAYDVVRQLGKTPIVVSDSRGFFTSRVFGTMVLEGAALLAEGMPPMSIERAATGAGFPTGPLTLLDEVTLTLPLKVAEQAAAAGEASSATAMAPPDHPGTPVLRTLVGQHGRLGKAAGAGFFDWRPEKRVWPGLAELYPPRPDAVPLVDAQERLLFVMAVETARCVEEGVLRTVEDANIGSIMGIGFPPGYGGVLQFIDQYDGGAAGFVARADELADRYGERFRPTDWLRKVIRHGGVRAAGQRPPGEPQTAAPAPRTAGGR